MSTDKEVVTKKLANYMVAGSAALAMGTANGAVIYTNNPDTVLSSNSSNTIFIDTDLDPDYTLDLAADFIDDPMGAFAAVDFTSLASNRVVNDLVTSDVSALTAGTIVGPGSNFGTSSSLLESKILNGNAKQNGQWPDNLSDPRYVGLEFRINGQVHYGWARVGAAAEYDTPQSQAILYDYAYESEPDTAITIAPIPEPATFGLFAMGAVGIAALKLRRKRHDQ